jgi:hypothetical protein
MPRGIPKAGERINRAAQRRANRPAVIDPNQFYSVHEYAAAREKCVASAYEEIKSGAVKVVKDGKRTKIIGAEIIRANQQQAAAA